MVREICLPATAADHVAGEACTRQREERVGRGFGDGSYCEIQGSAGRGAVEIGGSSRARSAVAEKTKRNCCSSGDILKVSDSRQRNSTLRIA